MESFHAIFLSAFGSTFLKMFLYLFRMIASPIAWLRICDTFAIAVVSLKPFGVIDSPNKGFFIICTLFQLPQINLSVPLSSFVITGVVEPE